MQIVLSSKTSSSVTVYSTSLNTSYDDRFIRWFVDGSLYTTQYLSDGITSGPDIIISGLSSGTQYTISANLYGWVPGIGDTIIDSATDPLLVTTNGSGGTSGGSSWTVYGYSQYTNLSSDTSRSISLGAMYTAMFTVSFTNSGTATFYTTGSVDTVGYLSSSTGFNASTGEPTYSMASDDESGSSSNFSFTYPVTAGTVYYLFVKCYSSTAALSTTVHFTVPKAGTAPALFDWDSAKVSGGDFNITASEWCRLLDKINEVRVYKGLAKMQSGSSVGYFMYPSKGDDFLALHYNQALMGIAGIYSADGYTNYYNSYAVASGSDCTAAQINRLRTLINNYCE